MSNKSEQLLQLINSAMSLPFSNSTMVKSPNFKNDNAIFFIVSKRLNDGIRSTLTFSNSTENTYRNKIKTSVLAEKYDTNIVLSHDISDVYENMDSFFKANYRLDYLVENELNRNMSKIYNYIEGTDHEEFDNLLFQAVQFVSNSDRETNEFYDYLRDNGFDLDGLFTTITSNGILSDRQKEEYNRLSQGYKYLILSDDPLLPEGVAIKNNILGYIYLSSERNTSKIIDDLKIDKIDEIKDYLDKNPMLMKTLEAGIEKMQTKKKTSGFGLEL